MNVSTSASSAFLAPQVIVGWTLLGLLLSWLIIFAVLSLRVFVIKHTEFEDLSTPSRTPPVKSAQPDGKQKHYVKVDTGDMLSKSANSGVSRDRGPIPVK